MVTRTNAFLDHNHSRKPRPGQWTRRPYITPNHHETPSDASAKPAIPSKGDTKSDIQTCQFAPGQSEEAAVQGRHQSTEAVRDGQNTSSNVVQQDTPKTLGSTSKPQSLPHANAFPCTPGARLPLEDLIGNYDELQKDEALNISPVEYIGWIPNSSSDLLTPNCRKRKHAKSSSPAVNSSSQPETNSVYFGDEKLSSSARRTPPADPAADLWQRYANGKQAGHGLKLPDITKLISQASPRPMETPVRGGPFRRWASTGNVDLSGKNKRRCTAGHVNINVCQDPPAKHLTSGKSKIATMVQQMQKIQESLASQQLVQQTSAKTAARQNAVDAPSSSSPLPETGSETHAAPAILSPLQSRQPNLKLTGRGPPTTGMKPPTSQVGKLRPTQSDGIRNAAPYQHAGDPLNPSTAGPLHLQSKAPLPAYKRPSISRPQAQPKVQQVAPSPLPAPIELDEFGDDAFDLTADDLDELLSQKLPDQRPGYDMPAHHDPPNLNQSAMQIQQLTVKVNDSDEFDCDIDDDSFAQAEFSAIRAGRTCPRKHAVRPSSWQSSDETQWQFDGSPYLQRYVVKQVVDGEYTNDKGQLCKEQVLLAENQQTSATTAITLRGSWVGTCLCSKDIVHIVYVPRFHEQLSLVKTPPDQLVVSDDEWSPFLIVHPDHMLSATTVADSFDCIRKAALQDRIKATGDTSKAMVYGKILHEIFQQALSSNQWDSVFLAELVECTVQAHVEGLWELGMRDTILAVEEIKARLGDLSAWAAVFIAEMPTESSLVDDRLGEKLWMSISKLIAIEEHIWSPRFGLKGNVDATIQMAILDDPNKPARRLIVPFEIKTGRTTQSPAHRAQTALYTLLLSDRYNVAVDAGILYYLESSSMSRVAPPLTEVRQMVQQRNRLSSYIFRARHPSHANKDGDGLTLERRPPESQEVEASGLPALLKDPFKCGRCYAQAGCFTYHALIENGTAGSAGMIDDQGKNHSLVWREAVGHLLFSTKHENQADALKKWFTKWDKLLTFEEDDQSRLRAELWTMSSKQREALGRCFGGLILTRDLTDIATTITTQVVDGIESSGGKINRFTYVFRRAAPVAGATFTEGNQLTVGEPVVVSSEQGQWSLANGYIIAVTRQEITVAVDRKLGLARDRLNDFDGKVNHAFRGMMTVGKAGEECSSVEMQPLLYRLDKDEFSNGLSLVRNNLVTFMSPHPIHTRLRDRIVFGARPSFTSNLHSAYQLQPTQLGDMNDDQHSAVEKVLSAQDYALILGMPGTGKTTTIAHIIRALLAEGKSVLLTSFTHTAVDNILLKIRAVVPPGSILRLGVPAKINNQVQEFCQLAATRCRTIEEVDEAYMQSQIVATTCMGTNHSIFQRRTFDVCIVDEASQITLPTILGPLLRARRFVLVGDHFQLPPLVQNKAAVEGGLDVSLFRQLSKEQPDSVAALGRQYRMCEDIMTLSNELIYGGKLQCGNEIVAERILQLRDNAAATLDRFHRPISTVQVECSYDHNCWLSHLTNPRNKVVFANTNACGKAATETLTGGKITNQLEATLSAQLVVSFLAMGVPASEIGVITLYRSQLALIRQLYKKAGIPDEVEIDSADRFQGRDKECIILSMVRNNVAGIVGDLLKDWRRVNVALTRARSKLIVLGSRCTLQNNELLAKFLALVDERRWSMDLPKNADDLHAFPFNMQATQNLLTAEDATSGKNPERQNPTKNSSSQPSPSKRVPLKPSQGVVSKSTKKRSPLKALSGKENVGPRRITGKGGRMAERMRLAREQVVVEIWEDLIGEEF